MATARQFLKLWNRDKRLRAVENLKTWTAPKVKRITGKQPDPELVRKEAKAA